MFICEVDEQWSFMGNKNNQRWLDYAWEPRLKKIIAYALGCRERRNSIYFSSCYIYNSVVHGHFTMCRLSLIENKHIVGKRPPSSKFMIK
ncbi:IS1 family transposase [Candidatus Enterovibrio escicola]|uniref:IS1 family transposase n=1 Tax=Candidatus Enterovibrio escicola TaxID=1927127 RepID=UPI0012383324